MLRVAGYELQVTLPNSRKEHPPMSASGDCGGQVAQIALDYGLTPYAFRLACLPTGRRLMIYDRNSWR